MVFHRLLAGRSRAVEVSVEEARERQAAGALLIDVREAGEWAGGHASDARHIPLTRFTDESVRLPRDAEILVICRSGNRSARAAGVLRASGFQRVSNVRGGMIAWERAGLPVSRG
jgi:rhodanese-related sulfurtransferase